MPLHTTTTKRNKQTKKISGLVQTNRASNVFELLVNKTDSRMHGWVTDRGFPLLYKELGALILSENVKERGHSDDLGVDGG